MLGAREHYAPVIMAEHAGWLDCFITDYWSFRSRALGSLAGKLGWSLGGRASGRYTPDIPDHKVRALTHLGLKYKWMLARAKERSRQYGVFEEIGAAFAREACEFLSERQDVFFGFSSASLETLNHAAKLGLHTVLDQIDPSRIEYELVAEEELRFPNLTGATSAPPESYFSRIRREWESASVILVNSDWSKSGLVQQGVPPEKIFVAPLGYRGSAPGRVREPWKKTLRVLWVGTLCLRKGLPYAIQAAEQLAGCPVQFTFAGPCDVQLANLRFPSNAQYIGPVARGAAAQLYLDHDVFILPTLSDGFGLTQIEAMAHGLPVISTPCCGEVVEHNRSGFRVRPRAASDVADSIHRLLDEPDLLPTLSRGALARSRDFLPDAVWPSYAEAIMATIPQNV